uniref:PRA1 family protein n=1 Tax=Brassica oleracea TaxID=3712 RepID=A0A3P6EPJ7_BRAOL|nr:unnamed protein product [Brassica oleracea]
MDWDSVAAGDVVEALREVEWSTSPRSLAEFFSRFAFPRSFSKWMSRLKCNLYYYRTNYFILLVFVLGLALITRPLAIIGAALTALSLAFLNDSFAATFNEKAIRTIRQFSPHLAAKMRPPHMPVIRGRSASRKTVYVCGQPRLVFVLLGLTASFVLWFTSCGLLWVLYALATALLRKLLNLQSFLCFWSGLKPLSLSFFLSLSLSLSNLHSDHASCEPENSEPQGTLEHIP